MDWEVVLSAALGSGVVVALVGGLVSLRVSERQIAIENITKERTRWRDKIRTIAQAVQDSAASGDSARLKALRVDLALSLNPEDAEDHKILDCVDRIATRTGEIGELTHRLSLLLKHDWERAKWEARPPWWRPFREPRRVKFSDSKYKNP